MKTNNCFELNPPARPIRAWALLLAALLPATFSASAQDQAAPPGGTSQQAAETNTVAEEAGAKSQATEAPAGTGTATSNGIDLNFRNAPIELVLQHLSDAAGFIIIEDTPVRGTMTVTGKNLTKEEALNLINTQLTKNNYAAVRKGRELTIMSWQDAKSAGNKVNTFNGNLASIPDNGEVATWIIPIRYVEAQQLISDVSPFVSSGATIIANQAGNSVIITDAQSNIRHLVEIIQAIDSSAEDVTEVRVFHLDYADPTDTANLLMGLFPDQTGATSPIQFRGGRGGFGGFGGRGGRGGFNQFAAIFGGQNQGNTQADRIKQRKQVIAVADPRTASVIVTATSDLMSQIEEMIHQIDHEGKRVVMKVVPVVNANPYDVAQALQDTVGANSRVNSQNTQNDLLQQRLRTFQNQYGTSSSISSGGFGGGGGRGGRIGQ